MKAEILVRCDVMSVEEEFFLRKNFKNLTRNRTECKDSLVIARYSALPFYHELAGDLRVNKSFLINSLYQHGYITSMGWIDDLGHLTPKTWFLLSDYIKQHKNEENVKAVLKGRVNSRKEKWNTLMYADSLDKVREIYCNLQDDPFILKQGIAIREYVPLKSNGKSLSGIPYVNEWRFFYYKNTLLTSGYYWSTSENKAEYYPTYDKASLFAQYVANKLSEKINFFVLDVAETEEGEWILIEVNDGQMSGLSDCSYEALYRNLQKALRKDGYELE